MNSPSLYCLSLSNPSPLSTGFPLRITFKELRKGPSRETKSPQDPSNAWRSGRGLVPVFVFPGVFSTGIAQIEARRSRPSFTIWDFFAALPVVGSVCKHQEKESRVRKMIYSASQPPLLAAWIETAAGDCNAACPLQILRFSASQRNISQFVFFLSRIWRESSAAINRSLSLSVSEYFRDFDKGNVNEASGSAVTQLSSRAVVFLPQAQPAGRRVSSPGLKPSGRARQKSRAEETAALCDSRAWKPATLFLPDREGCCRKLVSPLVRLLFAWELPIPVREWRYREVAGASNLGGVLPTSALSSYLLVCCRSWRSYPPV
ncbi:hypothetical protein KSP40_PGU014504 [Platanthera guangdongensis]|uniref:Uncharacterized protein n=1 Tax=Platanthera guangdongensis TaxID=2320717 RepID=A0ABR2M1A8_9ASPA